MYLKKVKGPRAVTLADGTVMTRADLPDARTRRWVASRKAAVVRAVVCGLITREQALKSTTFLAKNLMLGTHWLNTTAKRR